MATQDAYDIEPCIMMLGQWRKNGEQKIWVKTGEFTTLCKNKTAVLLGQMKHENEKFTVMSDLFYLVTFGDYMRKKICERARGTESYVRLKLEGGWYIRILYLRIGNACNSKRKRQTANIPFADEKYSTGEHFTTGGRGPKYRYEFPGLNIDTLAERKDEEIEIDYVRPWQAPGVSDAYKTSDFDLNKVNWDT